MIGIEEARSLILSRCPQVGTETVPLDEALGRTLAGEVTAAEPMPPFDNSAMDGFAVRAEYTAGATENEPVGFRLIGEVAAGGLPDGPVGAGEAMRIMTGAPMPDGADAVVMVERTALDGDEVLIEESVQPGENVRYAGEDVAEGVLAIEPGALLGPSHIGLAAALGQAGLLVAARPRVAIISTGDELVEPGSPLGPGQIRNSNAFSLAAQVREAGGEPVRVGIAKDTASDVQRMVGEAVASADVVITTGGVSVGEYDVVRAVLESMGELVFWRVAIRPGKPLAFAVIDDTLVFGVPGNPATSMVSFETFVRPALLSMQGRREVARPTVEAILDEPYKKKPDRAHLARAVVEWEKDGYHARPAGAQGSAILTTMVNANALLVMEQERTSFEAGEKVPAILLD